MIKKWKNMSGTDRLRIQILLLFGMVALYAPIYLQSSDQLFDAEKLVNRRKDRIEKRTSLDAVSIDGPNARILRNRIAEAEEQLAALAEESKTLEARFAPVDSNEIQQRIMLAISTLAERSGVRLVALSRQNAPSASVRAPGNSAVARAQGRPLLDVTARARFDSLFHFLNALETLPYHVCVMNLKLYTSDPKAQRGARTESVPDGSLHVQLVMSL